MSKEENDINLEDYTAKTVYEIPDDVSRPQMLSQTESNADSQPDSQTASQPEKPSEEQSETPPEKKSETPSETTPSESPTTSSTDDSQSKAETEDEFVDPLDILREKCLKNKKVKCAYDKYLKCNDRVNAKTQTLETCMEEFRDYMHLSDKCVMPKLFKILK